MRPTSCFGVSLRSFGGDEGGGRQRKAPLSGERPSGAQLAAARSQGPSLSSLSNEDENAKQHHKPKEIFPCENQNGSSEMFTFRRSRVFTKRSRNSSVMKIAVNEDQLQESDEESDLITDVSPQAVNKKQRVSRAYTNRKREKKLAPVVRAEKLHDSAIAEILGCTEEKSDRIVILQNHKDLNKSEKLGNVSPKANESNLPAVNTDILKVLEESGALAYSEEKPTISAASIEADKQKGILKQGNADTSILMKAFVQEHTINEDCVRSGRVTQSVLCTGPSSKDATRIERPYKQIINTEESQNMEGNGDNDSPEDTYPYATCFLNNKESEVTLSSSSAEEEEPRGENTDISESDDPLEECRRIFDEFEREAQKKDNDKQAHGGNSDISLLETKVNVPGQKRRIAHRAKFDVPNKNEMAAFKVCPWQQGYNAKIQQTRWEAMEVAAAVQKGQAFIATTSKEKKTMSGFSATRFQSTGPMVQPIEASSGQLRMLLGGNVTTSVPCGLSVSSFKRTTCVPCKVSTRKRPSFPESASKVPLETRQRYVGLFIAEYFKICSTVNEATEKALIEEQSVYDRCGSKKMYLNYAVKTFKKLRDHGQLSNSRCSSGAGSIKSEEEKAFTGGALYELLKKYLLTEEQLNENNFPRRNPEKSGSAILTGIIKNAKYDAFKRVCCRCGEVYAVTSSGEHIRKEECNYHSGRVLEQKVPGGMEKCYSCCERIVGSTGCQIGKLHVHDGRMEKLEGFVKTYVKSPPFGGTYGIYSLDCETCYTTHGMELTRVAVVDANLQVVYDTLVKPDGKVLDYDTRLSGVTEDDLKNATTSLRDVQAILLDLFSADTVLIGHSLEKDFFALKLIHDTVVDTSTVFPHRLGLPYKRALRCLVAEYLSRIHEGDVGGHNSRESAIACMELILWKVKKENQRRKQ